MRKKNVLAVIDSLEQINNAVARNLESNIPVETETLADCQDAALEVGNEIEKRGQEGEEIVHLLEAYCENIYQMNCVQTDISQCRKLTKKIQKQLVQIRNRVKYDLSDDKRQVVFLPYKASMWDSLESVWKAADADPDCDAYVIPIPYFDKNPDGSFREMHYEGDQYPDYVPVVSWEEYDIEAEHPDAVYIHNPYDEFNLVTSVHPAFYSKKLKNYTDELVYIPYFILNEIAPDNQAAVQSMEHFCAVPAVVHADKVIVQSEKMRQVYINVMSKTMGEDTRIVWEKKIFGLGSPKIDKLLNTRKENLEIPEEWMKVIEKPDGSWKKIVFYNTSVSALLANDEKMLRKMESVFEIFKEDRDEVALLWRPHPLVRATIESMRPKLWEEYEKIVEKYKKESWGIYDDSADLDRAIILSDAYYGDESSVVQLYRTLHRPVLLQYVDCLKENDDQFFLSSNVCCLTQDCIVLISEATNAVVLISKKDWTIKSIFTFEEEMYATVLYLTGFCDRYRVIAIPYYADDVRMLNLLTGSQSMINDCMSSDERKTGEKFITSIVCGKNTWIIGENIKRIIGMDTDTLAVFANIAFADIQGLEDIADKIVWGLGYVATGNNILLASRNYGIVLSIDNLTNKTVVCARLENEGFSYIYEYNKAIFLIDQLGYEYLYDIDQSVITKTGRKFDDACWKCIVVGEKRYYFEAFSGKVIKISGSVTEEIIYKSRQNLSYVGVKFLFVQQDGKYIYFQERFSGYIFILDTVTDTCVQQKIDVSSLAGEWQKKTIEQSMEEASYAYLENPFLSVENLLQYLGN